MENKRLFGKICLLQKQMYRQNCQLLGDTGVTPVQMNALWFIRNNALKGIKVMQKDVEKHVGLCPSSVSALLSNLEKDGYLLRTVADGDARGKYLALTGEGESLCLKNKMLMDKCDGAIQNALTDEEQKDLEKLLTKIINSVSEN